MIITRKMLLWDGEKRLKMIGSYFESLLLRHESHSRNAVGFFCLKSITFGMCLVTTSNAVNYSAWVLQ